MPSDVVTAFPEKNCTRVEVRVEDLIAGRTTLSPVYFSDRKWLPAGSSISEDLLTGLRSRGVATVELLPEDAFGLTTAAVAGANLRLDVKSIDKLHALFNRGVLFSSQQTQAAQESAVLDGCNAFDQKNRAKRQEMHREAAKTLAYLMKSAVAGEESSFSDIARVTGAYLASMTGGSAAVMPVSQEAGRDANLSRHCVKMSVLAMGIALEMGYDESSLSTIGLCGLVHDWGMVKVPEEIRNAPRKLTDSELFEIKKHPVYTLRLLEQIKSLPSVIPRVCYQVHEQPNGEGYPRAKGPRIHEFALILGTASAYAALTSPRPQRPALMPYAAMEFLFHMVNRNELDAKPVKALLNIQSLFPIGSYVKLSDGRIAQTLDRNGENFAWPIVQLVPIPGAPTETEVVNLKERGLSVALALPTPGQGDTPRTPDTTLFW